MNVTPEHPVYVEGKGWLWAENLSIGDRLRRADGGMAKVLSIERVELAEAELVYNFTVKGPYTYFVLEAEVLVHNARCGRRYAPVGDGNDTGSGLPRKLQDDLVKSLDEGGVVASRSRPRGAAGLEAKYPPKGPDVKPGDVKRKRKNGVRELTDGRKVLSDLDIAGYTIDGRRVSDDELLGVGGFKDRFNKAYENEIIMHGAQVNGLDDIKVVKKLSPGPIQKINNEIVYVFDKNGFVEALPFTEYEVKYVFTSRNGNHLVNPLGRGSTGRITPKNLKEQLAMQEVMSNTKGTDLPIKMSDPRWPAEEGWVKRSQNVNGVEIHYLYNKVTGEFDDFKFKDY